MFIVLISSIFLVTADLPTGWPGTQEIRGAGEPTAATQPVAGSDRYRVSDDLFKAGCDHLEHGRTVEAIDLLSQAVARQPKNLDYQLKLACAHVLSGRADAAIRLLENAISQDDSKGSPAPSAARGSSGGGSDTAPLRVRAELARIYALQPDWAKVTAVLSPVEDKLDDESVLRLFDARRQLPAGAESVETLRRGLRRLPRSETLTLALADHLLENGKAAAAAAAIQQTRHLIGDTPALYFRAAKAYFQLGELMGKVVSRPIADGREGQFFRDLLIIGRGHEAGEFICCPKESALYQLRRALDGGIDTPEAHLMHARIWQRLGKPEVGLGVLAEREEKLLENPDRDTLATFSALALEAGQLPDYLRYSQKLAQLIAAESEKRSVKPGGAAGAPGEARAGMATVSEADRFLREAYLTLAERYNQRGDDALYIEFLGRASRLFPKDAELLLRLADAEWQTGSRDSAAACLRRVLELEPGHAQRQRIIQRLGEAAAGSIPEKP